MRDLKSSKLPRNLSTGLRAVGSDLWAPSLAAVGQRLPLALHLLDRLHIRQQLYQAVDEIRKSEAGARAQAGRQPRLKKLRWA